MTAPADSDEEAFLAAAVRALDTTDVATALESLGWWDLLVHLGDYELRRGVFALFRAQGRCLASSPALGALVAQPYLESAVAGSGSVVATLLRTSARRGPVRVVVGDVTARQLLVDRPGHGAWLVEVDDVELRPLDVPGRLLLHEVEFDLANWQESISERDASSARDRSLFLGRVATACEILGAAETAVELAVEHARNREQFGKPIGTFQAVRHLLAWARTDCVAIENVIREAVRLDDAVPPMYGEVVKALAGRNGRRACERSLQVLGGIGFTSEHDHHHFHSRVLALDALLGTSAELTHEIGAWLRTTEADPGYPKSVVVWGSCHPVDDPSPKRPTTEAQT